MPNAIKWEAAPVSRGTVLTTELNALANAARTNAGTAIDNSVNLDKYGYLELLVDFVAAPSSGAYCAIYLVMALDGTNYAQGSSSLDPGTDSWVISIPLAATTAAQNKQVGPFLLPGAKFKLILENQAGTAFPATGSTLELFTSNDELQ